MLYLFFLTVAIFAFILVRRNRERSFRNSIEGIAKLGVVEKVVAHSNIFLPSLLFEVVLRPKYEREEDAKKEEEKVVLLASDQKRPEMINLRISSHRTMSFQKYVLMEALGKMEWHELRPVIAEQEGIWRLARFEEEVEMVGKVRKVKRVLSTKDFLYTGERIGAVTRKLWMQEKEEHHYYAPSKCYPLSLQVSDGAQVKPGDILVILAIPTGKSTSDNPN